MTASVINPFAGYPVGFTWAQHVAAGLTGGTDYKVPAGVEVKAAMDGEAVALGPAQLNAVSIRAASGLVVSVRELRSHVGGFPRQVKQGDLIGVTGLIRPPQPGPRWPHVDANRPSDGKRVEFEQYIGTTAALDQTGLDNSPTPTRKIPPMPSLFHDLSTNPFQFALAGGSPGTPANWLPIVDIGLATEMSAQIGASSAGLDHTTFLAWKAAYLAPVTISGGASATPVDTAGLITAIDVLGTKIDALPEVIDQYADGKKQSS